MLSFNCPKCNRFCAVVEDYAGHRVRCTHCNCRFIVPAQQGDKAQRYNESALPPLPEFYREVFVRSWKILFVKDSVAGLVFCIAMTCFQFFLGNLDYSFTMGAFRPPLIIGWITQFFTLGGLFWYFFQTIGSTILYPESLPELDIGFGFEYFGGLFKSLFLFLNSLLLTAIPSLAVSAVLESLGFAYFGLKIIMLILSCLLLPLWLGLFGCDFPIWITFRVDVLIRTLIKTVKPYLASAFVTELIFFGWLVSLLTFSTIENLSLLEKSLYLAFRIVMVILMLFAMRTIGLYYRHYKPACPWLWDIKNTD
jgi:hypothetical protein